MSISALTRSINRKLRVLLLAGGRSDEHEVSILSARSIREAALNSPHLEMRLQVITREGNWLSEVDSETAMSAGSASGGGRSTFSEQKLLAWCDIVFPALHGPYGEDGAMQGFLELANKPYVGSGVLASALCMDKPMSKEVLRSNNAIPLVNYVMFTRNEYEADAERIHERIVELKPPWFVKPANLGSSVGVSKINSAELLHVGIRKGLHYDRRIIVEEGVQNVRELEIALLGNENVRTSQVGEVTYDSEFYDYDAKYRTGEAVLHIPAKIPSTVSTRIKLLAVKAYKLLDCAGFARADFLYDSVSQELYFSEINTIPGCTAEASMFPKLWQAEGVNMIELIETLICLAFERHAENK